MATGRRWVRYVIALGAGLLAVILFLRLRGFWEDQFYDFTTLMYLPVTPREKVRIASDAFFIVGAMMASWGAIFFVSSKGAFDGIAYSIKSLTWFFRFREDTLGKGKRQSYYEYKESKAAKPKLPFFHLVTVGLFFVLIAGILTLKFLKM